MQNIGVNMSNTIREFKNEYRWLSNFWPVDVELSPKHIFMKNCTEVEKYPSVEHAYQAAKFIEKSTRKEIAQLTAGRAKKTGGSLKSKREDFDDIKLCVMETLLRQKFAPSTFLAEKLKATWPADIIEGNSWGDTFWGMDLNTGVGANRLGRLLMEIRFDLQK